MRGSKLIGTIAVLSLLLAGVAQAQTYNATGTTGATGSAVTTSASGTTGTTGSTSGTGTTGTTPGAPNTGAGGDMTQNLALLAAAGIIVLAGGAYLARRGSWSTQQ